MWEFLGDFQSSITRSDLKLPPRWAVLLDKKALCSNTFLIYQKMSTNMYKWTIFVPWLRILKDEILVKMDNPFQVTIFDSTVSVYIFLHYADLSLMT